jgi:hypothetical protein
MLLKEAVNHIDNFNPTQNPQNHKTQISQRKGRNAEVDSNYYEIGD